MRELITKAEYARRRGVSKQAVCKAANTGRITLVDGKVDPEVADVQWARNTDPAQAARAGKQSPDPILEVLGLLLVEVRAIRKEIRPATSRDDPTEKLLGVIADWTDDEVWTVNSLLKDASGSLPGTAKLQQALSAVVPSLDDGYLLGRFFAGQVGVHGRWRLDRVEDRTRAGVVYRVVCCDFESRGT